MQLLLVSLQKNGAAPRDALEFSNGLCELHAEHTIIIAAGNELRNEYTNTKYRTVKIIPTFSSSPLSFVAWSLTLVRPIRLFRTVASFIRHEQPTVVLTTHFHPWVSLISLLRRVKTFTWYYGCHENPFTDKERRSGLSKRLEQKFVSRADVVICYSNFVREQLQENRRGRIITMPLGAYASALRDNQHRLQFPQKEQPLISCIGRLEPYKGLQDLVEAYAILRQHKVSVDLLIAGRGDLSDELKARILDLGIRLENRWLRQAEATGFVMASDLIVLPYRGGSQSGMISLALAVGRPVIATRVGGLPEQVDEGVTGALVDPGNPRQLAAIIEELLRNPEKLEQMGMSARVLGSGRLSWKRSAEIFLASLKK